jgi:hypothetical protein
LAPIQSAIAQIGAAKQSAKGSVAASPTYAQGLTGGAVITVEVAQELEERTSGVRMSPAVNRTGVMPGVDMTARAHPKGVGLWLYGALGAVSTSGSGTYTHVFSIGDDLPYLTAFGKLGSNIYSVRDVKVDTLGLSFEAANPVELSVAGMGTVVGYPAAFSPVNDDTRAAYFTAATGTFKLDVDSATPLTASITAGEINIANNLETIMLSGSISPDDVFPGRHEVEVSFDIVVENLNDWRTILTGTSSGSSAEDDPVYGSFEVAFTSGTTSLTLASTKVAFTTEFPEANPSGGPVTLTLAGLVVQTAAGAGMTATLVNDVSSY